MGRLALRRGYTITALTAYFRFALMLVLLRSMRGSSSAPTSSPASRQGVHGVIERDEAWPESKVGADAGLDHPSRSVAEVIV
jgi:hypothetical protein